MQNSSPQTNSQNSPGSERVRVGSFVVFSGSMTRFPLFQKASSQSLRPVTIKQVLKAEQAHSDAELYIDGTEVSQARVFRAPNRSILTSDMILLLSGHSGRTGSKHCPANHQQSVRT